MGADVKLGCQIPQAQRCTWREITVVYEVFPQPILNATIQQLRNKVAPYSRLYLDLDGRKQAAWAEHRRIYDACVAKNGDLAEAETRRHLAQVFDGTIEAIG